MQALNCKKCGEELDHKNYIKDGDYYCENCTEDLFFWCDDCQSYQCIAEQIILEKFDIRVCKTCFESDYYESIKDNK